MYSTNKLGKQGEYIASCFLLKKGFQILKKNYRSEGKEIDIIAKKNNVISFIEVKYRSSIRYGHPLESITKKKQAHIIQVASAFMSETGREDFPVQFSVISILRIGSNKNKIEYIENAFQPSE